MQAHTAPAQAAGEPSGAGERLELQAAQEGPFHQINSLAPGSSR